MKHKVIEEKTPQGFTPFTIQITAESIEELRELWKAFNYGNYKVWDQFDEELKKYRDTSNDH